MSSREERPDIRIRPAMRADVPAIVRLYAEDFLGSTRERFEEPLPVSYYQAFAEIEAAPHIALIVVEADGDVIGTLQMTFVPNLTYQGSKRAHIEAVHVDARFRNQGVGTEMLAWAVKRAREEQCRLVQLTSNNARADAKRFYERAGFTASHCGMKLDLGG